MNKYLKTIILISSLYVTVLLGYIISLAYFNDYILFSDLFNLIIGQIDIGLFHPVYSYIVFPFFTSLFISAILFKPISYICNKYNILLAIVISWSILLVAQYLFSILMSFVHFF